jgi:hypothetical protein
MISASTISLRPSCATGQGGAPLLDKVRAKLWVFVGVDGVFGVASKGLHQVGHAGPKLVLGEVNSP